MALMPVGASYDVKCAHGVAEFSEYLAKHRSDPLSETVVTRRVFRNQLGRDVKPPASFFTLHFLPASSGAGKK